jgi:hypothetical protein
MDDPCDDDAVFWLGAEQPAATVLTFAFTVVEPDCTTVVVAADDEDRVMT